MLGISRPPPLITQYKTLDCTDTTSLDVEVERLLSLGWELHGDPRSANEKWIVHNIQTMVKRS